MSQKSIDGMMFYVEAPTNIESSDCLDEAVLPAMRPALNSSLSYEVVSHLFTADEEMLNDPGGGGEGGGMDGSLFDINDISAASSVLDKDVTMASGLHMDMPLETQGIEGMMPIPAAPSVTGRTEVTGIAMEEVEEWATISTKKQRPLTKRKLRELEAQRTMSPEKFKKWREYREKNNLSVQNSRRRKREKLKEAAAHNERLRMENMLLSQRVMALESKAGDFMNLLASNIQ